jgi:hypothetical protein
MRLGFWALLKFLLQLAPFMKVQIAVAFVHRVLSSALLCDDVVVDDVVVWLLKNLPGLRDRLHQAPLRNPEQLPVN